MERGLGWHYPAGADNADAPWNQVDGHHRTCPAHEDNYEICADCEGVIDACVGDVRIDCTCAANEPWYKRLARRLGLMAPHKANPAEPVCTCDDVLYDDDGPDYENRF